MNARIVQGERRTSSLLERYTKPQPIFCKDSANQANNKKK